MSTLWITGASSGIGAATALEAVRQGHTVVISARREEQLAAVREQSADPSRVHVVPLDVTDTDAHPALVASVWEEHGPIDAMVHNAGISQRSLVEETDLAVDRRLMEVNYFGVASLTKAILPLMLERGQGHFTVVSSVAGYVGTPLRSSYAGSKHALHGFFNSLRAEVHDRGVGVTLVCPGYVDTDITVHALTGDGEPLGIKAEKQSKGVSAESVARRLLQATFDGRTEVHIGGVELAGIVVQRLSPSLAAMLVRKLETT